MTDLHFEEILRQEYAGNNCVFSAGFVSGHEVDTMYIRLERDGEEPTTLLLRADEMACIAWLASGVLWSQEMKNMTQGKEYLNTFRTIKLLALAKENEKVMEICNEMIGGLEL